MVPVAGIVLLIPSFFVTIFIEGKIYRAAFRKNQEASAITRATWKMHLVTYGLLVAIGFGLLGWSIANHNRRIKYDNTMKQSELIDPNAPKEQCVIAQGKAYSPLPWETEIHPNKIALQGQWKMNTEHCPFRAKCFSGCHLSQGVALG